MVLWRLLRARLIAARSLAPGLVFLLASCAAQTLPPVAPTRLATSGAPPPYIFQNVPASFRIDAAAAYVVESQTDTVLYEYNSDARIQPGSLAKLMTLYLVLDAIDEQRISLDSRVTITEDVAQLAKDPAVSLMFLRQGQQVPVRDLLYGMMVSSGCDAALALANAVGGNSVTFVIAMNARARRLGMTNTNFATPNGLPVPGQVTTAHDMAILALAVIKQHPEAFVYTSRRSYEFNRIRQRNTNGLLFIDPRVNGLKTGHVREAGFHLLASAKSEDLQLVSLVLGTQSHTRRTLESRASAQLGLRCLYNRHAGLAYGTSGFATGPSRRSCCSSYCADSFTRVNGCPVRQDKRSSTRRSGSRFECASAHWSDSWQANRLVQRPGNIDSGGNHWRCSTLRGA